MFQAMTPNPTPISRDYHKKIVKIIQALLVHEQSSIFRKPIPHKALAWEDYKDIVKRPTDLNFVRRQYNEGKYKSVQEALDEIQLIWDNVFAYGKRDHQTFDTAIKMQKYFDELLRDLMPEYHEKINRTAYFKQFQNKKPQKKVIILSNPEKNSKKIEKMQIQSMKEEIKQKQKQPQVITQNKRRQPASIRRQQNSLQTNVLIPAPLQSTDTAKKTPQVQQKPAQRKSLRMVEKIEEEEPVQQVQQNVLIEPDQSAKSVSINDLKQKNKQKEQQISQAIQPLEVQPLVIQPSLPQPIPIVEPIEQESQDNHFPPIIVSLNKTPSFEEISEVTQMMQMLQELQEMDTLSKIVRILTKYEKQNMIIDGDEVNFRMNEIHISTYSRIRKQIQDKIHQINQSDRVRDFDVLKERFNVKLMNGFDTKVVQNSLHNQSELQNQQN